jgi:hypothetical protein
LGKQGKIVDLYSPYCLFSYRNTIMGYQFHRVLIEQAQDRWQTKHTWVVILCRNLTGQILCRYIYIYIYIHYVCICTYIYSMCVYIYTHILCVYIYPVYIYRLTLFCLQENLTSHPEVLSQHFNPNHVKTMPLNVLYHIY